MVRWTPMTGSARLFYSFRIMHYQNRRIIRYKLELPNDRLCAEIEIMGVALLSIRS